MRRAKLGDVIFSVVKSESVTLNAEVTDKSVESGQDIADHMKPKPPIIAITGVVTGPDAGSKLQRIKKYQSDGELLRYIGRNAYKDMVIEGLETDHGASIRNGFGFSLTLKRVKIATAKKVEIKVANPVTKAPDSKTNTQVKPKTNKGKQQPRKKTTSQAIIMRDGLIAMTE